ncbi:ATP-binding protein [Aquitalea aquatilis]|uniref:ATP-binding protein n=1 Tax=Aquitalea aquatilis TaxID=1537400 RepID=UPI0010BDD8D7|nr:HAMP domain-containing sensor histidine kinase [Aquitalea aquatilis]
MSREAGAIHCIKVQTKAIGEKAWHALNMDWRPAFLDPTLDASDKALDFKPTSQACESSETNLSGTSITITDLQSDWSKQKLVEIASLHLAKLADPFAKHRANKFMEVTFQDEVIPVPTLDKEPLNYVDAVVEANLRYDDNDAPILKVHVNYITHKKERTLELSGDALRACVREGLEKRTSKSKPLVDAEIVARALNHLGPWELKFYWFNRGRIQRKHRELYDNQIKSFLEQWSGGLLIYRDGYRVYPYGGRSDDWLDLDKKALASSAYKLNRAQIVGYLRLSSIANPALLDQTNREGFRDSPDREALKRVLRWVIAGSVRQFLEQVDREIEPPLTEVKQKVDQQITTSKGLAVEALRSIKRAAPTETTNVATVMRAFDQVSEAWERAKLRIENFDKEIEGYIHLAGVGLMLEFIAHELSRVTQDTLKAVTSGKMSPLAVEAQLKTLEKRVRILDELSIPGRQLRFQQSILDIALLLSDFHQAKAARSSITLRVTPTSEKNPWEEKVEKGQVLQILDNLISNSFYWLDNRFDKSEPGVIDIQVVKSARQVRVTDNGPGVPNDRREFIFEQFATTKPPREGRGLGLYIARRLAEENGATLELAPPGEDGMARTFILEFGNKTP